MHTPCNRRLQRDVLDDNYAHDALFTAGAASSVLGPGSAFATGASAEAPAAAAGAGAGGTEAAAPAGSGDGEGAAGADEGAAAADGGGQAREAEVVQVGGAPLLVQVRRGLKSSHLNTAPRMPLCPSATCTPA